MLPGARGPRAAGAATRSHLASARGPGAGGAEGLLPKTNGDLCQLGHQLFQHLATGFLMRADIWLLQTEGFRIREPEKKTGQIPVVLRRQNPK